MLVTSHPRLFRYGTAILSPVLALIATLLLRQAGIAMVFPLFYAAVAFSVWYGGFGLGLLSIALSALLVDYFFLSPIGQFSPSLSDVITLLVFLITNLLISMLHYSRNRTELAQLRLAAIVESSDDAIFSKKMDGTILSWNPAAMRLYGYQPDEIIGKSVSILMPPDRANDLTWIMEQIRRGNHVRNYETVRITKVGRRVDVSVTISPIRDRLGHITSASTIARDITAQKQTADALLDSNQALQAVIDFSPLAIIVFNTDGIVDLWSPAAARTFGWSAEEAVGQFLPTVGPDKTEEFRRSREAVINGASLIGIDARRRKKDGSHIDVSYSTASIRDRSGQVKRILTIVRDVTEQRRSERAIRFLSDASKLLVSSLDYESTLRAVAQLAVESLADWCTVEILEDRRLQHLASQHKDPAKQVLMDEISKRFPVQADLSAPLAAILVSGKPRMWPQVTDDDLTELVSDEDHRRMLRELGINSLISIPLLVRGKVVGLFTCSCDDDPYSDAELLLAEELISRASLALDNALLYREINEQREQLQVTLSSIGDAVLATDIEGRITFLNPVAERLTGWSQKDAIGCKIEEIYQIADEYSHQPLENPVRRVLASGETVGLANHTVLLSKTGQEFAIDDSGAPIRNERSQVIGAVLVFRDVRERRRAEMALVESEKRFRSMADTAPVLIWMADENGEHTYFNRPWLEFTGQTLEHEVDGSWRQGIHADDQLQCATVFAGALQTRSNYVMNYRLRRADGEYRWMLERGVPRFTPDSVFAGYIGSCIDVTELKLAEANQRFLQEVSTLLASSLDYKTTLSSIAHLAVPEIADWCTVHTVAEDGSVQQTALAHADPARIQWAEEVVRRYPGDPSATNGLYEVIRSGRAEFYPDISEAMLLAATNDPEILQILREVHYTSVIIVPLSLNGQTFGAMQLVSAESGRHYTAADLALAEELAHRAAMAMANARLYQDAEAARMEAERAAQRTARLQRVTEALSEAITISEVADAVIRHGLTASGATAGSIALLSPDGRQFEIIAAAGYPDDVLRQWQTWSVDAPTSYGQAVRTRQPLWLGTLSEREQAFPAIAHIVRSLDHSAIAAIPFLVEGQPIGAMGLSFAQPQQFDAPMRALLLTIAQQCSQALERARLYAETRASAETLRVKVDERTSELQTALMQAQSADRAKSTLLSTVSHEMRTPLSSIIGFSNLILSRRPEQAKLLEYVTFINLEARRLAGLINDFLDLQRIEAGREVFRFVDLDLALLVQDIAEKQKLDESSAHRIHVELALASHVYADSDRVRQVIVNLLSNAIKYSSSGGEILLSVGQEGSEVIFSIQDRGIGIPPDELGKLFERFYRGDAAERQRIRGTGLGLALCRELIQAQGGRIWAESAGMGHGSTFRFALPAYDPAAAYDVEHPTSDHTHEPDVRRILVVGDDPNFAVYLGDHVAGSLIDYLSFEAATPQAIATYEPALIVMDVFRGTNQPGWSLLAGLKQLPTIQNIPVIICSVLASPEHAWLLGASAYLSKPVDETFLLSEIKRLIGPSPRQILVVDDDPTVRLVLTETLGGAGYQTEIAENSAVAISYLEANRWPDLIVLDLLMPDVDGFAVLDWIRHDQKNLDIPVIAFTAAELTPEQKQFMKERASALAKKSEQSPQQLLALIKKLIMENETDASDSHR